MLPSRDPLVHPHRTEITPETRLEEVARGPVERATPSPGQRRRQRARPLGRTLDTGSAAGTGRLRRTAEASVGRHHRVGDALCLPLAGIFRAGDPHSARRKESRGAGGACCSRGPRIWRALAEEPAMRPRACVVNVIVCPPGFACSKLLQADERIDLRAVLQHSGCSKARRSPTRRPSPAMYPPFRRSRPAPSTPCLDAGKFNRQRHRHSRTPPSLHARHVRYRHPRWNRPGDSRRNQR